MKRLLVVASVLLALVAFNIGIPTSSAQGEDQCPDLVDWEEDAVRPLLRDYDEVEQDASDLEIAAELQAARREFDREQAPPAAMEAKAVLIRMVDLRADAVVASYLRNEGLAERLVEDAEAARDEALRLLNDLLDRCEGGDGESPQIVLPEDGAQVVYQTIVEGTYDPAWLGENQLWVVLLAQNNLFYPQVIIDSNCSENSASSMTYGPRPGTWRITVYVGEEGSAFSGQQYDIILYVAEPDEHEAMLDLMAAWCRNRSYPGLSDVASPPYGFEFADGVRVTRQ